MGRKLKNRLEVTQEEIRDQLDKGLMQLHTFHNGVIVTQVVDLEGERIVHVVWMQGEKFGEWKAEALDRLTKWGREHGCKAIEADCRPGLALLLRPEFRTVKIKIRADICPA